MKQPDSNDLLAPGPGDPVKFDCNDETFARILPLTREYGDVVRAETPELKNPQYLISNPRDIKQVLVSNHSNYIKGIGFERVEMLLGNGIIVSNGKFWRRQRTMIQPAFSRKLMHRFFEMIRQVTLDLADRWEALADTGEAVDITTETGEYALQIILRALLSEDLDFLVSNAGSNPFAFLTEDPSRNLMVAMKFRQMLKQVQVVIDQRRADDRRPFDLLSTMMDATSSKTGEKMTDRELIDEVATMIIAGHETSAGTLNWAWYLLSGDSESEARMAEESSTVSSGGLLEYDQVANLTFTHQVLEETLRLYPPVWMFTRRAVDDDEIGGYRIFAGDHIFLSPWLTQHLPQYWPDPEQFRPERFSDQEKANHVQYAFFPFSAGPRRCIGEFFSLVEMKTHLAIMCRRFRLVCKEGQQIDLEPAINLRTRHSIQMYIETK